MEEPRRNIPFDVLIDDSFVNICTESGLSPIENKTVLGFANDYEDGDWRYKKFSRFVWNNIKETALSAKERNSLIGQEETILEKASLNLRVTDNDDTGGEISEILLYGIMRNYYQALPIVPKIYYKQNSNDFAKGADSVHIVVKDDENFELWLGEAKFFTKFDTNDIDNTIASIQNTLNTEKIRKENAIITNVSDINELEIPDTLKNKIKQIFSPTREYSVDLIRPLLHIPIMILYQCKTTSEETIFSDEYKEKIIKKQKKKFNAFFTRQVAKLSELHQYSEIKFHLILFPVPNKKKIVDNFKKRANFYRDEY